MSSGSRKAGKAGEMVKIGDVALPVYDCPEEWQPLVPEYEPYEPQHDEETIVAIGLKTHFPVMIEGPAGGGKNAMMRSICHRLNRPLVTASVAEGTTQETFVGMPVPVNSGMGGIGIEFRDGLLTRAMRNGWVIELDEVNMGDERVLARTHDVMANGWTLFLPEDPNDPARIVRPYVVGPDGKSVWNGFGLVATGNPHNSGKYTGTKELNMAFRDRFLHCYLDYIGILNPEAEARAIVSHTGIKDAKARRLVQLFNTIRRKSRMTDQEIKEAKSAPLYVEASTRAAIQAAELIQGGISVMRALETALLQKCNPNDRPVVWKLALDQFAADGVEQ